MNHLILKRPALLFHILVYAFIVLISNSVTAQLPSSFEYQAAVSNMAGPIQNTEISVRTEIIQNSISIYAEIHNPTTNEIGSFNIPIGLGQVESGDFQSIDWSLGNVSLLLEFDPDGGSNFESIGEFPLYSVPYALFALDGGVGPTGPTGPDGLHGLDGNTGQQGTTGSEGEIGVGGADGSTGDDGELGPACFDFYGDGICQVGEDTNGDGMINVLDCHGVSWVKTGANFYLSGMRLGIGTSTPTEALHVNGNICYTGSSTACSDRRYKEDIQPIENALTSVTQLNGVSYFWKRAEFPERAFNNRKQIGLIAQEVEAFFPQLVLSDVLGYKSVDYSKLNAVLIEAVKVQQFQIEALQEKADEKEQEFNIRMSQIEALLN